MPLHHDIGRSHPGSVDDRRFPEDVGADGLAVAVGVSDGGLDHRPPPVHRSRVEDRRPRPSSWLRLRTFTIIASIRQALP